LAEVARERKKENKKNSLQTGHCLFFYALKFDNEQLFHFLAFK